MTFKTRIIIVSAIAGVIFLGLFAVHSFLDTSVLALLDELIEQTPAHLAEYRQRFSEMRTDVVFLLVLSSVLGVLLLAVAVFAAGRVVRCVLSPLRTLRGVVRSLGFENADCAHPDNYQGGVRQLALACNEMSDRLTHKVRELQEGERRYRAIVQDQIDFLLRCRPDGTLTFVNDALARYMGSDSEAIVGTRTVPFLGSGADTPVEEALTQLVDGHEVVSRESLVMVEGLGPRWQVWTVRQIRDDAGILLEYQAVGRDVTDQKASETRHKELEEKYRQAQKMEAIGQLAGGVAHDFNNLLQVILGFSEIAMLELGKDVKQREMIHEVLNAANRAKTLVGQLLAFSRRQVLTVNEIDVNEVVGGITKMIRRIIGEHIDLEVVAGTGDLVVKADRGQLEQVLMNLCVNARDAMPSGGTIRIETRALEFADVGSGLEGDVAGGEYVLMSVSDTGIGMDEGTKRHIFEPFFTTKGKGEGTGLGLATVYGIVLQHNGFVDLDSTPGEGTTFRLYLPLSESAGDKVSDSREEKYPSGTETILVVEDEDVVRAVARRMLERAGYRVLTAASGQEALEIFDQGDTSIDMLLCDVVMPGMSGPQTFIEIKKRHPDLRCLFATGYATGGIHDNYVLSPGTEYVQKPYELGVLLNKIREILDA